MKMLEPSEKSPEQAVADGEGLKVLVVDDNELHAEGTAEALQAIGYECVIANSGKAGARQIESDDFDVILTDLRMPDLDGLMATRAIKEELPRTSILIVTLSEDPDYLLEALRVGAAGFVLKDASRREVVAAVRQVLGFAPVTA